MQQFDPENYHNAETISAGMRVLIAFGPYIEDHIPGLVIGSTPTQFTVELDDTEYQGFSIHTFLQADGHVYVDQESTRHWATLTSLREREGATFGINLKPGAISVTPEKAGCFYASWWIQHAGVGRAGISVDRRTAIADMYNITQVGTAERRYLGGDLIFTCGICQAKEYVQIPRRSTAAQVITAINKVMKRPCNFCADKTPVLPSSRS